MERRTGKVEGMVNLKKFYKDKRVFVTGHTGFKGSWLTAMLHELGAEVCGYARAPQTDPALFGMIGGEKLCRSHIGDIADFDNLKKVFDGFKPQIVFHLAAQPIVREGYKSPRYTYQTNVMGTVNVFECIRLCDSVKSVVNVTTDKVYENKEWVWGYRENDVLDGYDPYANSKSCSELVTACYKRSFLNERKVAVSAMRAGNVIGGGDYSADRIVPACVEASAEGREIVVRNPHSVRPYQFVCDPLVAYLAVAAEQWSDDSFSGCYNIGPENDGIVTTGELADIFVSCWNIGGGNAKWINRSDGGPHEANLLKLDCEKLKKVLPDLPRHDIKSAVELTVEWEKKRLAGCDMARVTKEQIRKILG